MVLETCNLPEYKSLPPSQIVPSLADKGLYIASESSFYRILREDNQLKHRGKAKPRTVVKPEPYVATGPNQVWTWDITKLPLVRRGIYLSLSVVLDLFSRFVVAWMVSLKENSALSQQLMDEATARYGIEPGQLTLHQDRGSPMIAYGYLDLMRDLDVTCSHSRPRVSNDNPFSESQFKTQKYQPDYPGRFNDVGHARRWCEGYFDWYNFEHHHSGLAGFTTDQVFTGCYHEVARQKQQTLDGRYESHPERFVRGRPTVAMPPETVAINPVVESGEHSMIEERVNFPTLTAAGYVKEKRWYL